MLLRNITYGTANISYRITGLGSPVLLLHGFGEDGEVWNKQVDFLKAHFTLIIPDLPGSGNSGMIEDMSIEGMAEVVKEIIIAEQQNCSPLNETKITLIGHSMGLGVWRWRYIEPGKTFTYLCCSRRLHIKACCKQGASLR